MADHFMQVFLVVTCSTMIDIFAVMPSLAPTVKYTEQEDLSCNACQFAVKELDSWLRLTGKKGHYSLEGAVSKSLEAVCDKKNIEDENVARKMTQCRELLEEHGLLIKESLVEHYESDEPGSYLQLIQQVCHGKLNFCNNGKKPSGENSMELNPVTNKMEVSFSGTIKTANPVKEGN